jgi:hypothetical protein
MDAGRQKRLLLGRLRRQRRVACRLMFDLAWVLKIYRNENYRNIFSLLVSI